MKSVATAALWLALSTPAWAALPVGTQAPVFSAPGTEGHAAMTVDLSKLLKGGPVVLFFFPSVFTGESAEECHEFADAIDKFHAAGATIVGMSRDTVDALGDFSTKECGGKFPLASADPGIVTGFDVNDSANFTTNTTYVISPEGKIVFVDDSDADHARSALAFIEAMKR